MHNSTADFSWSDADKGRFKLASVALAMALFEVANRAIKMRGVLDHGRSRVRSIIYSSPPVCVQVCVQVLPDSEESILWITLEGDRVLTFINGRVLTPLDGRDKVVRATEHLRRDLLLDDLAAV